MANNEFLIGTTHVHSREDLIRINQQIVKLGERLNKPVVATGDVHFLRPEDSFVRTILLAGKGMGDVEHPAPLLITAPQKRCSKSSPIWTRTKPTQWWWRDPRRIAEAVEDMSPVPSGFLPAASSRSGAEAGKDDLRQGAGNLWISSALTGPGPSGAGIEGHYRPWVCLHLPSSPQAGKKSLDDGYLVGSRGSVGSSLVATMCEITEVNPLPPHYVCPQCHWSEFFTAGEVGSGVDLPDRECPECGASLNKLGFDIPFEVFMGFHGDKVPGHRSQLQRRVPRRDPQLHGGDVRP